MEALREYINSLAPDDQESFALRCGTTVGYIRKALSIKQRFRESLVIAFERESGGIVRCESIRPDVDWAFIRSSSPKSQMIKRKAG